MGARVPPRPMRLAPTALAAAIAAGAIAHAAAEGRSHALDASAPEAAIAAHEDAVRALERSHDRFDPRLAEPLHRLGRALAAAGRHRQAATVLGRAVFVRRADAGLFATEPLELYDDWMESLYAAGRDGDVAARQLARVAIVERAHGRGSPEALAALADAARWLRRVDRPEDERALHERRLEALESAPDPSVVGVASVLRDVAGSYAAAYDADVRGLLALTRALEALERAPADDRALRAEILAELGDFYFLFRSFASARHYHERARALVAGDPPVLAAILGEARPLHVPEPYEPDPLPEEPSYAEAHVSLTVSAEGDVRDVRIVEIRPDTPSATAAAIASVRRARFRPRLSASGPLESRGVSYRHRFRYAEGLVAEGP